MEARPPLRDPRELCIGVADPGDPEDVAVGSGWTASLLRAMDGVVGEAVPLSVAVPGRMGRAAYLASLAVRMRPGDIRNIRRGIQRGHNAALIGRPTIFARSLVARRRLASIGPLDGILQRGSEMRLPRSARVVTYEDSTVRQAVRAYPWPHLRGLTERDLGRYAARQSAIYRSVVACCAATHWVRDSIVQDYGITRDRVHVVGLGANHVVEPPPTRDWSNPRFLFIGVDWARKNGSAVLRAFARVRDCHPKARLDVVGEHPRLDADGVTAHGRLSLSLETDRARIAALYRAATAYVMPSLHEPAGSVFVEAGSAGIASIGSTNGGASTAIGPGGMVVDPGQLDQITEAMLELSNPSTAARLGALAHEHAKLHSWRKVAERLVRALAISNLETTGLADFL